MQARLPSLRSPVLRTEGGFAIVEVMVAALIVTVGVVALVGAFDSARKLNLLSERRTTMAHQAQRELERLQTYPYSQLAMIEAPTHSSETTNPDYYVNYNSPLKCSTANCYAWNAESTGEEEAIVVAKKAVDCAKEPVPPEGCGIVSSTPSVRKCDRTPFIGPPAVRAGGHDLSEG